ncbi:MAG: hypothetical protein Q8J59_07185 [Methylotenera sp.]|nr:hypothetical protein [Methylotenera sp.]MDO9390128.1 hypothetical protein [Methylotenera sp.]MDP2101831.1 hypothetical protein [Methylotenera sp.]MDP2281454.1 hypothetical protein [Methylotenera sp.]MDP3060173.1 hypothetical protein [Methylotenera sp.]
MTKKKLLIAALLLSTSTTSLAVEWDSIIKKADYEILVDIDSYNVANGFPYILTKTVFKKSQTYINNQKVLTYQYQIKSTQFNCKQSLFKTTSTDFYNRQNKRLISEKNMTEFKPIIVGSDEFSVAQLVCQVHKMVGGQ